MKRTISGFLGFSPSKEPYFERCHTLTCFVLKAFYAKYLLAQFGKITIMLLRELCFNNISLKIKFKTIWINKGVC